MKLKVGDLAARSGLSVRTLHHYDAIGLLRPTQRTPGGARVYGEHDVRRLHRIQVLKGLGYALPDIRRALDDDTLDPRTLLDQQAQLLDEQARRARTLSDTLRQASRRLAAGDALPAADWLGLLELSALYERHLTPEERQRLQAPQQGQLHDIERERRELVAQVRDAMRRPLRPSSARARDLAWRWVHMVVALTSNDAALAEKLRALQQHEPLAQQIVGIDTALLDWIGQAIVHARVHLFSAYLSAPQTAQLRRRQLAHRDAWPPLVAQVRQQLQAGTPATAAPMRALAARWRQLFRDAYCGDDLALEAAVRRALAAEPRLQLGVGVDDELMRYVYAALATLETT